MSLTASEAFAPDSQQQPQQQPQLKQQQHVCHGRFPVSHERANVGGTTSQQMHPRPALSRRLGTALGLGDAQALSAAATLTAEWNRSLRNCQDPALSALSKLASRRSAVA